MAIKDPVGLLRRLIKEPAESDWLEFKHNNNDVEVIGSWISACANAAILAGKERAFMIFGVQNVSRSLLGTSVVLHSMKKGGENFVNWISRMIEPRLMMEFLDFKHNGLQFSIICIEPTYDRPVKFAGVEYIRIGENVKRLAEYPDHERSVWIATGRRKFESAIAASHQTVEDILEKLDADTFYKLTKEQKPRVKDEIIRRFELCEFIKDDMEGGHHITNLGALVLAKDIREFGSISGKSVRVIKYVGNDKRASDDEIEGQFGYAVGFSGLLRYINKSLPRREVYNNGIREVIPAYPETAIREVIANALIHQDFTVSGAGPVIEIFSGRIEITNPGNSLIDVDRIIDERRSRNEKLAATMRLLNLCEERGGGLDKAGFEIEESNLPAPEFLSSKESMRVILFGPKSFSELTKTEKQRACFFHCILRYLSNDNMSNTTLRARFKLEQADYQAVSAIISEALKSKRIVEAETNQGRRNAKYVPYWARKPHK